MKRAILLTVLSAVPLIAQDGLTIHANMKTAMTAEQRKAAGLDKLTASQEQAFDQWLRRYAADMITKVWQSNILRAHEDDKAKVHMLSGMDEDGHYLSCVVGKNGWAQCFGN